jgi:4-carboxymuconolactone decarboxylase
MSASERRERGLEKYREVYGEDAWVAPEGEVPAFDIMLEQLFAEIWTRSALSVRDRRLLAVGVLAANGRNDTIELQMRRALELGELDAAQLHEVAIMLAHYAGWPLAGGLGALAAQVIAEHESAKGA